MVTVLKSGCFHLPSPRLDGRGRQIKYVCGQVPTGRPGHSHLPISAFFRVLPGLKYPPFHIKVVTKRPPT